MCVTQSNFRLLVTLFTHKLIVTYVHCMPFPLYIHILKTHCIISLFYFCNCNFSFWINREATGKMMERLMPCKLHVNLCFNN